MAFNFPHEIESIRKTRGFYKYITPMLFLLILLLSGIANPKVYRIFTMEIPGNAGGVNFSGFTALPMSVLFLNYLVTGFLGYAMIRRLVSNVIVSHTTRIFAGFLFGYVGILAIARVLSLFFSGLVFYGTVVFFALAAGSYLLRKEQELPAENPKVTKRGSRWYVIEPLIFLAGVCFVLTVLALQITQGEFSWVGHGPEQYAHLLQDWVTQGMGHFPIVFQHYDELLYHYWATLFFIPDFNPIIPWWLTLSLVKLSIFSFLYIAFRKLDIRSSLAFVMSLFLMFGSSSLLMKKYYLLFDASNPLFFTVHSGRIVGVGVAIFLLLEFLSAKAVERYASSFLPLFLLGLGITTTSLSNGVWVLFITIVLCFISSVQQQAVPDKPEYFEYEPTKWALSVVPLLIIVLLLMQPFIAPHVPLAHVPRDHVFMRLVLCLSYVGFCIMALCKYYKTLPMAVLQANPEKFKLIGFILVMVCALLTLGNMTSLVLYEKFPRLMSLCSWEIQPQILSTGSMVRDVAWQWSKIVGDHREIGAYLYITVSDFAAYYGIFLCACLGLNTLVARSMVRRHSFSLNDRILFYVFLCIVTCIPLLFFFMNYVGVADRAWIKSRFLEVPVYLTLFISFYFANRLLRQREKIVLAFVLLLYCVVPFVATHRPQQILDNVEVFTVSYRLSQLKTPPTITASSQLNDLGPQDLLLQRQPGWHAEPNPTYPQSLVIDFHQSQLVKSIGFLPQDGNAPRSPKRIKVSVSENGKLWEAVGMYDNICSAGVFSGWHNVTLQKKVTARFMQIDILANCGDPSLLTLKGLKIK